MLCQPVSPKPRAKADLCGKGLRTIGYNVKETPKVRSWWRTSQHEGPYLLRWAFLRPLFLLAVPGLKFVAYDIFDGFSQ